MKNLMFITDNLDELEKMEKNLESKNIPRSHIHVFSKNEAQLENRDIPSLNDFSKRDLIRSGIYGALLGGILSGSFLMASWAMGWTNGLGIVPVGFVTVALFGFCTWEGGLWGIQTVNRRFDNFREELSSGSHLLIVDAKEEELNTIKDTAEKHPQMRLVTS